MYSESHTIRISRSSGVATATARPRNPLVRRLRRLVIGPPATHSVRGRIPKVIADADVQAMVPTIRAILKSEGKVRDQVGGLEWSSDLDIVRVNVVVGDEGTDVEVWGDARLDVIASYSAALLFLVLAAAGLDLVSTMGWWPVVAALLPAAWLVGRVAWHLVGVRFENKLRRLTRRLVERSGGRQASI